MRMGGCNSTVDIYASLTIGLFDGHTGLTWARIGQVGETSTVRVRQSKPVSKSQLYQRKWREY